MGAPPRRRAPAPSPPASLLVFCAPGQRSRRGEALVGEVFQASVAAIRGEILWLLGLLAASLLLVLSERLLGRLPDRGRRVVVGLSLAATAGIALRLAWKDRFLCDDAFISFRYARNFAEGHG